MSAVTTFEGADVAIAFARKPSMSRVISAPRSSAARSSTRAMIASPSRLTFTDVSVAGAIETTGSTGVAGVSSPSVVSPSALGARSEARSSFVISTVTFTGAISSTASRILTIGAMRFSIATERPSIEMK